MKKTAKFLAVLLAVLMMASTFTAFAQTDLSGASYHTDLKFDNYGGAKVNGGVTVFEFKLPKYTGSIEGDRYAAFSLLQNCGGTDYVLDLVSVDKATGNIVIGSAGEYFNLCTSTGEAIVLQDTPANVAVVYDDNNGTARYFVNGSLGYVNVGGEIVSTADLKVFDTEFYSREYVQTTSFRLFESGNGSSAKLSVSDYEFNAYNVNKGDTARILGFQENGITDQLRIIAGIDSLYYNKIGFEIEPFIGGVSKGVSEVSENIVFSSVSADDKTLTAESFGHRYLAAAEITSLPRPILENSYLSIRAYTEIDGVRYYDEAIKIVVHTDSDNNLRYFFDKDGFIYTNTFDDLSEVPSEWKFSSSETGAGVSIVDDAMSFTEPTHGPGGAYLILDQYVGMNALVQADITITGKKADNSYLAMLYGYKDATNFDYIWIRYNGEGSFQEKKNSGSGVDFPNSRVNASTTGFSFELDKTYTLTLIFHDGKASFFVDGVLLTEGELDEIARSSTGKVGFMSKGLTFSIDNFIVRTTDDIVENDVIYSTDFEDVETVSAEWVEMTSAGVVKTIEESSVLDTENGKMIFTNLTNSWTMTYLNKDLGTGDYIVQADVKITEQLSNDSYLGLIYRLDGAKKFVTTGIRMNGEGWIEAQTSNGWSTFANLGDKTKPIFKLSTEEEEHVFTLTAICQGETISFYVNGTLIGTGVYDDVPAEKTQLGAEYLTGKVGLYAKGVTMEIDNFVVKNITTTYSDYIVYEEDFNSYAALPDGWKTTSPGTEASVSVTPAGKLNIIEPKGSWFITYLDKDLALTNYEFSAKITVNEYEKGNAARYFGLVFNYKDANNFAKASFRINGEGSMGLMRLNGAAVDDSTAFNLVEDIGITPAIGKTYTLKVKVVNDLATFYVDDKELGTYNLSGRLAAGKIGFIASGVSISVDDVNVSTIEIDNLIYDLYGEDASALEPLAGLASTFDSGGTTFVRDGMLHTTYGAADQYIHNYFSLKDENGNFLGYNEATGTNDYVVTTELVVDKAESIGRYLGLALRYSGKNSRIEALFRFNGKSGEGQGWIEYRSSEGSGTIASFTLADTYKQTLVTGKKYTLKGVCQGNTVSLYLDDVLLATGTIPNIAELKIGTFGFTSKGINYSLDNYKVTAVDDTSKVLYENDFDTDWEAQGLTSDNKIVIENGKYKINTTAKASIQLFLDKEIAYNPATKTYDYAVEAIYTVTDWQSFSTPNFGLIMRQDPDSDGDGNFFEHNNYVYAGLRTTGQVWIQGYNTSNSGLNVGNSSSSYVALKKGSTYVLRATFIGDQMSFTVIERNLSTGADTVIAGVTVENPIEDKFNTGIPGFVIYGISGVIESYKVIPLLDSDEVYYSMYEDKSGAEELDSLKIYDSNYTKYISLTDEGKIQHVSPHSGGSSKYYYIDQDFGYNPETGTNDYSIEMNVTLLDSESSHFGFAFRGAEKSKFIYAGIRTNVDNSFIDIDNDVSTCPGFNVAKMGVSFGKDKTITLKLVCQGDDIQVYVNNILAANTTLKDEYKAGTSNNRATGLVGFASRGVDFQINSFVVRPIYTEEVAGDLIYSEDFSDVNATIPTEWHDEIGARRNGVIANLSIGTSAKNNSNGSLIVDARGSTHNVIALDKTVDGGFIYELDLTMLRQDNIDGVSYKMGPVFGLQDDSISVGVDSRIGGTAATDVEAWLLKNSNSYYPGVNSSWHNFGSFNLTTSVGTTYRYKIVGANGYASIYVDGKLMLTCAIDDPFLEGRFGIMLRNAAVSIDNVKLQKYLKKYEIPADPDTEPSVILRVATFNIGDFSTASGTADIGISKGNGTDVTKQEYIDVFEEVGANVWGLQEDSQYFNGNTKESANDAIYSKVLPYHDGNFTGGYNSKAFLSGYELYDVKAINYSKAYDAEVYPNGTTDYGHPWFLTGKVMVNDVEVTLVTMHFDWQCKIRRAQQIADILEHVKGLDYVIVLGDVNPDNAVNGEDLGGYVNDRDNQYFIDQGYTVANGGEFGLFYTTMTKGAPRNTNNPCDNIYTSSKITMLNAEPVYMSWMNDHAIVIADIEIK